MATVEIKRIGAGFFSQVFSVSHSNERRFNNVVIKVGGHHGKIAEDTWWEFANWVQTQTSKKKCPGRIHLPVIKYADQATGIAIMGKLFDTIGEIRYKEELFSKFTAKYFPKARPMSHATKDSNARKLIDQISDFARFHSRKRMDIPRDFGHPSKDWKNFVFFMKWFRKKYPLMINDLHHGNMMFDKDMNIVITDPSSWA